MQTLLFVVLAAVLGYFVLVYLVVGVLVVLKQSKGDLYLSRKEMVFTLLVAPFSVALYILEILKTYIRNILNPLCGPETLNKMTKATDFPQRTSEELKTEVLSWKITSKQFSRFVNDKRRWGCPNVEKISEILRESESAENPNPPNSSP